jgi:hypothetical protein
VLSSRWLQTGLLDRARDEPAVTDAMVTDDSWTDDVWAEGAGESGDDHDGESARPLKRRRV